MASTNRIAAQTLTVGQQTTSVTLALQNQRLVLDLVAVELVAPSQVRLVVLDARGLRLIADVLTGSDTQRYDIASSEMDIAGSVTFWVECLRGEASIVVNDITGTEAVVPGASGAQIQTTDLAPGILAASATGRALMATGFIDNANVAKIADDTFAAAQFVAGAGGKFAPDCLDATAIANVVATGALSTANLMDAIPADALTAAALAQVVNTGALTTANLMDFIPADAITGAAAAQIFLNGSIPGAKLAAGPFSLDTVLANPAATASQAAVTSGQWPLTAGAGAEWRGLPIPTIAGQVMLITHVAGAWATIVRSAQALDAEGTVDLNFAADLGQWVLVVGTFNGAALRWKVVAQGGGVANSTPVYVPLGIAYAADAATINPTCDGYRADINFVGAAEHRHLGAPLWEGQKCTVSHTAGANAGTLIVDNGFNSSGALDIVFPATFVENVTFVAVNLSGVGLRWRIAQDAYRLSRQMVDPGAGLAIPVTYDDGIVNLTIAAPADDRTLANASYEGQRLTIVHSAGANAGTVTAASDINPLVGGQNVINFTAGLAEMVVLQATSSLAWRIVTNPNALVLS
jgi:hypothetical protein